MNSSPIILSLAILSILITGLILAGIFIRRQRTRRLQQVFGPEYDLLLRETGDQHQAEKELEERQKKIQAFHLRTLSQDENQRFLQDWDQAQNEFVENPSQAVEKADQLISEVLLARGYPNQGFEDRVADISVDYPELVSSYRNARATKIHDQEFGATIEELQKSFIQYRELFNELIQVENHKS